MKKGVLKWALTAGSVLALLVGSTANAGQFLGSYHVKTTFVEGAQTAGLTATEIFVGCLFNIVYIDLGTVAGRAQLALAMSAKVSGQAITRVDYTIDAGGKCFASGLHVE